MIEKSKIKFATKGQVQSHELHPPSDMLSEEELKEESKTSRSVLSFDGCKKPQDVVSPRVFSCIEEATTGSTKREREHSNLNTSQEESD